MKKRGWVLVGATVVAIGCGGQVGGDSLPNDAEQSLCEAHRSAVINSPCPEPTPPEIVKLLYDECLQLVRQVSPECRPALERFYECSSAAQSNCGSEYPCEPEARSYALCVSGGSCAELGGGRAFEAQQNPDRASTFDDHRSCECLEPWEGLASGAACRTWEECRPVCCACPGSTFRYTAAACDFAASADFAQGICPSPDRVCALTSDRCP